MTTEARRFPAEQERDGRSAPLTAADRRAHEERLAADGVDVESVRGSVEKEVDQATEWALSQPMPEPGRSAGVFADADPELGDGEGTLVTLDGRRPDKDPVRSRRRPHIPIALRMPHSAVGAQKSSPGNTLVPQTGTGCEATSTQRRTR